MNLAQAQAIYFQGMKLALAQHDRRYGATRPEEAHLVKAILDERAFAPHSAETVRKTVIPLPAKQVQVDETRVGVQVRIAEIAAFAEAIIKQKESEGEWDAKTQRQARSISRLLVKFLQQDSKIEFLNDLRQTHLSDFVDFLRYDIYKYYGRSSKDETKTISRLREDALEKSENKRGIVGETINRHCTFIGQVFDFAMRRGAEIDEKIEISKLRSKKKKSVRARNARAKLRLEVFERVFHAPPFINSAAWNDLGSPGAEGKALVFHGALYFVPQLIYYCGGRREEFCGLLVDDVILDNGLIPYLHIAKNEQRRIKNLQSQRNVPLHPELIRLGFLRYVTAIKALGYKLLFPDLYSPTTQSPMGDRFYKLFKPVLVAAGATEAGLGSHAVRHLFGAQLKSWALAQRTGATCSAMPAQLKRQSATASHTRSSFYMN
jgi:integrase